MPGMTLARRAVRARNVMPAGAVVVTPADDVGAVAQASPEGAVIWFQPGVYRERLIYPKNNQTFLAAPGAVLNGSKVLTGWVADSADWYVGGQTQRLWDIRGSVPCVAGVGDLCGLSEAVYLDDVALIRVATRAALAPGKFFFDFSTSRIYLRDNPTGHTVETATTDASFQWGFSAVGVTIAGFKIEKYGNAAVSGCINAGYGWIIRDNEIRLCFGNGLAVRANCEVRNNYVHHCGQMGCGGDGDNSGRSPIIVAQNELAYNGNWAQTDPSFSMGGAKLAMTNGGQYVGNYVHHNFNAGLWTDISNVNTVYRYNRIEYNSGAGIAHEISYAASIENNTLVDNGSPATRQWMYGSQIMLQNSQDCVVRFNTLTVGSNTGSAITLIQQSRGAGPDGDWLTRNNVVTYNTLNLRSTGPGNEAIVGAAADFDEPGMSAAGNTFDYNTYNVVDPATGIFAWPTIHFSQTWTQFRANTGQEAHGAWNTSL